MRLVTGIFESNVDEKGRFLLPSRMRQALDTKVLYVLPGFDENHLMLMTPSYFEDRLSQAVLSSDDAMFSEDKRSLIRRLLSPAIEIELDSAGRINIPLKMREEYGILNKSQVTLLGVGYAVEVWNSETYAEILKKEENKETLSELAGKLIAGGK